MKRSLLISTIATMLLLSSPVFANLTDGLLAYYPFNGNANDATGNGHDGTLHGGPTLTTDRFGNANSAYALDGEDAYIEATNPGDFGFHNESFSVSVWGLVSSRRSLYETFVGLDSNVQTAQISKWPNSLAFFAEFHSGASQVEYRPGGPDGVVESDTWYHLVIVANVESGNMEFYGDGSLASTNSLVDFDFSSNTVLRFGARFSLGQYLLGSVDDIRIYNRALTASDVTALYTETNAIPAPGALLLTSIGVGFVGWFRRRRRTL